MSISETSSTGSGSSGTLTAFYDEREDADDAVRLLHEAGIAPGKITVVAGKEGTGATTTHEENKGFWASLSDFFMPDEDRSTYAEGLRRGGYLVTVTGLNEAESEAALDILDDEGTVDLDEREKSWRSEGWTGYDAAAISPEPTTFDRSPTPIPAATAEPIARPVTSGRIAGDTDETIPVVEETLKVGKRDVNLGRVRVRSYVVETPVSEDISLHDERVTIDRRPVDRAVSASDALFQDRSIEAEEHAEEAVISKEARVTEEIGIRKAETDRVQTVSDSVRSTKVEVDDERTGSTNPDPMTRKPL